MLENAIYYSRREQDEIAAAKDASSHKATQIHLLLAEKYAQLAKREMAAMPHAETQSIGVRFANLVPGTDSPRRFR